MILFSQIIIIYYIVYNINIFFFHRLNLNVCHFFRFHFDVNLLRNKNLDFIIIVVRRMAISMKIPTIISTEKREINEKLKQIFPDGKNCIINKGIQAITYDKFLRFCQVHKLNINLFSNIMFFDVTKEIELYLRQLYRRIKQDNYYLHQNFSFTDFLLVCVAANYNIPIVSFDNHIIHHLQNYMTYNVLWPTDVIRTKFNTPILLDTNVIYSLVFRKSDQLQNILQMIQSENITFLIPGLIINELTNLYLKEKNKANNQKINKSEAKHGNKFIDETDIRPKYHSKKKSKYHNYNYFC